MRVSDAELLKQVCIAVDGLKCVNLAILSKRNPALYEDVLQRTAFLPPESRYEERMFCIRNGLTDRPVCQVCRIGFLPFDRKLGSYRNGCCHSCTCRSEGHKRKMLAEYGVESHNAASSVKACKARSMLDRYGVDNPSKIPEVQAKKTATSMRMHGVRHWTNPDKAKSTYKDRTGYDNPSQNPEVKAKKERSCEINNGCRNPSESTEVKDQKRLTCLENNGVEYGFMLSPHVMYNSVSGLSKRLYGILDAAGIVYEKELRLYDNGTYRSYDIVFQEHAAVLELNGDFWHANPNKFRPGDIINLPHIGKTPVTEIWRRDTEKKCLAESRGYDVFYLWECELKKMDDVQVLDWIQRNILVRPGKL